MNACEIDNISTDTSFFCFEEVMPGSPGYERYLEFRYEVFCKELQRIDSSSCLLSSNGRLMETDQYDQYSHHFVAHHKCTGIIAASARVILPSPVGLNVSPRYIIESPLPYPDATDDVIGEISRMAIAPQFRRRHEDQGKPFQGDPEFEMNGKPEKRRQHQPELVMGMYLEIYRLCKGLNIGYCMAAMDNRYSRLLNTLGIHSTPVGPINESVRPPRRVYIICADDMELYLSRRHAYVPSFLHA